MSQCARVLAVLDDGRPHTMTEIHERAGTMRLNSRISELRERGHTITCSRVGGDYVYQLVSLAPSSQPTSSHPGPDVGVGCEEGDGQLTLIAVSPPSAYREAA